MAYNLASKDIVPTELVNNKMKTRNWLGNRKWTATNPRDGLEPSILPPKKKERDDIATPFGGDSFLSFFPFFFSSSSSSFC